MRKKSQVDTDIFLDNTATSASVSSTLKGQVEILQGIDDKHLWPDLMPTRTTSPLEIWEMTSLSTKEGHRKEFNPF